ncbi:unnamed protein product, partial [Prorocentrum cordatum]
ADDLAVCQLLASGDRGVLTVPDAWPLFAAGAGSLSFGAGEGDLRTPPMRFDRSNPRFHGCGDAVVCFSETVQAGWPVAGTRTCKWLLHAIHDAGWTPAHCLLGWRNLQQVSHSDAGVEKHAYMSEALERAGVFDQLNCPELETFEVLSMRYQLSAELSAPESAILTEKRRGRGEKRLVQGAAAGSQAQQQQGKARSAGGPLRERSPALSRPQPVAVGSGMAFGPQPPDDRPRDLLPFPGGRVLDELLLGAAGGGLSAAGRISLLQSRAGAAPLCDVVPDGLQRVLAEGSGRLRDPAEVQAALHELWHAMALDPALRLRGFMCGRFLAELLDESILEKAAVVKETSGAFFVKRKDSLLRLVFDARRSNCHFAPPPYTSLASGESLADLEGEPAARLWVASADIEVCIYQCELPASLRPLFVPPPILARYLPAVWRKRLGLAEGDVECAFQVLVTRACEGPSKLCYVDNLAVISDRESEAVNGTAHMLTTLEGAGVKAHLHIPDPSSGSLELLGFEHVARQQLWRPTPRKLWRVAKALERVSQAGATPSGLELERLIGHLVSMMMLRRDLFSVLSAVYHISRKLGRSRAPLWPSARRELRWAHAPLPAIVARSDLQWLPVVTAYDALEWGLGVVEGLRGVADVDRVG